MRATLSRTLRAIGEGLLRGLAWLVVFVAGLAVLVLAIVLVAVVIVGIVAIAVLLAPIRLLFPQRWRGHLWYRVDSGRPRRLPVRKPPPDPDIDLPTPVRDQVQGQIERLRSLLAHRESSPTSLASLVSTAEMEAQQQGLLQAIRESYQDDTPRLIYADWLEEHGEELRAEFIRLQCLMAHLSREGSAYQSLKEWELRLYANYKDTWFPHRQGFIFWDCQRGFIERVDGPVEAFLEQADELFFWHPVQFAVVNVTTTEGLTDLANCPHINQLQQLIVYGVRGRTGNEAWRSLRKQLGHRLCHDWFGAGR